MNPPYHFSSDTWVDCQNNAITCKWNSCTWGKNEKIGGLSMEKTIVSVDGASGGIAKKAIIPSKGSAFIRSSTVMISDFSYVICLS